ncbi:hypothetical protein [Azospirillum formosense]|uniref:hypothetical protein n=1 Tax=Azospirillum formosense TaxID=861533 RepID=UPI0031EC9FD5
MALADLPHVARVDTEQEISAERGIETVAVIYTDLVLDETAPDYDKAAVDALVQAANNMLESVRPHGPRRISLRKAGG